MRFQWIDYNNKYADLVNSWLDEEAKQYTGCDDGWEPFYEYWKNDGETILGETFWCKLITDDNIPFAVIALGLYGNTYTIMEYVVDPQRRGTGYGTSGLRELLRNSSFIIGKNINCAEAIIYPNNIASQKVFEKAGFVFDHVHPDGDAYYYTYRKNDIHSARLIRQV